MSHHQPTNQNNGWLDHWHAADRLLILVISDYIKTAKHFVHTFGRHNTTVMHPKYLAKQADTDDTMPHRRGDIMSWLPLASGGAMFLRETYASPDAWSLPTHPVQIDGMLMILNADQPLGFVAAHESIRKAFPSRDVFNGQPLMLEDAAFPFVMAMHQTGTDEYMTRSDVRDDVGLQGSDVPIMCYSDHDKQSIRLPLMGLLSMIESPLAQQAFARVADFHV